MTTQAEEVKTKAFPFHRWDALSFENGKAMSLSRQEMVDFDKPTKVHETTTSTVMVKVLFYQDGSTLTVVNNNGLWEEPIINEKGASSYETLEDAPVDNSTNQEPSQEGTSGTI